MSTSAQLQELVGRLPDDFPRRAAEPYRQAVVGIYARLVATARGLGQVVLPRHAVTQAQPYAQAAELRADLDVLYRSLFANGSALIARGRLRALRRAVEVFGFHLASVDLRQNSQVHERTLAELFRAATGSDYAQMPEAERVELLLSELATARPLISPFVAYSEETAGELDILRTAADAHRRYGRDTVPNYVISMTTTVSDILEAALLLKEVGLLRPLEGRLDVNIVPLFETIGDLRGCGEVMDSAPRHPRLCTAPEEPRRRAGGHARLFRQQQGRRLPDLGLGAVQGRGGADRSLSSAAASTCAYFTAAAARSVAAADRATRPSWRSRRAPSRPASASPSRAR